MGNAWCFCCLEVSDQKKNKELQIKNEVSKSTNNKINYLKNTKNIFVEKLENKNSQQKRSSTNQKIQIRNISDLKNPQPPQDFLGKTQKKEIKLQQPSISNDFKNNSNHQIGNEIENESQKSKVKSLSQKDSQLEIRNNIDNLQNESTHQAQMHLDTKVIRNIYDNNNDNESNYSNPIDEKFSNLEIEDNYCQQQLSLIVNTSLNAYNNLHPTALIEHEQDLKKQTKQNDFNQNDDQTQSKLDKFSKSSKQKISYSKNENDQQILEIQFQNDQQQKNSNSKALKQYRNNQDQQYQSESFQNKIDYGIKNKGNTCYINSALQMLRQIYQEDKSFLEQESQTAKKLKSFFKDLKQGQIRDTLLNDLIDIEQQMQEQQSDGGDSYLAAFNYLSQIIEETSEVEQSNVNQFNLTKFQQFFTITFEDGLACEKCNCYLKDDNYFQETDSSLDYQYYPKYLIGSIYQGVKQKQKCQKCEIQSHFKPLRRIVFFPQFIIARLPKPSYTKGSKKKELVFQQIKYQLIGYCNYTGVHYTYTAKQNDSWITFNDSSVYETELDLSLSLYQLYKKI